MWWALGVSAALVSLVGGGLGLVSYFGRKAREIERKLGEANGEILSLQLRLIAKAQELEAMRVALEHALDAPPTLDDLERVSALAAGSAAAPAGAADAIDVP